MEIQTEGHFTNYLTSRLHTCQSNERFRKYGGTHWHTKETGGQSASWNLDWILAQKRILVGKYEVLIVYSLANNMIPVLIS